LEKKKTIKDLAREKQLRDVNNICRYARFVICVERSGLIVNIVDRPDASASIIAVVLVADLLGDTLAEQVLLEVGYGRTRPYAAIEKDEKLLMKERKVRDEFPLGCYPNIFRAIFDCAEKVVIETCSKWEKPGDWFVKGIGYVGRGVTFTISRHDEFLYRQMLVEDLRRQRERNIDKHVRSISQWLGHYKRVDYTDSQFKSFEGVRKTAELLTTYEERPRHRDALLRSFRISSKVHALIERIIEVFKIDFSNVDPEAELIAKHRPDRLISLKSLWVRLRPQPSKHARGCIVAEVGLVDQSAIWLRKERESGNIQSESCEGGTAAGI
jgi:hypothetical protein